MPCPRNALILTGLLTLSCGAAHAIACLVVGERTARVQTSEGERSPVFMAPQCESLRQISGKALASWVGRDGKPRLLPIGPKGVEQLPEPGAEERSVNVVWTELSSKREAQRPAYMRAVGDERPPRVYLPPEGLVLVARAEVDSELRVASLDGERETAAQTVPVRSGNPVRLTREMIASAGVYLVQIKRGDLVEQWRWRALPAAETQRIDAQLVELSQNLSDGQQQLLVQAMLFEQLKLRTNLELTLQSLR